MPDSSEYADSYKSAWDQKMGADINRLDKKAQKEQKSYYEFRNETLKDELDSHLFLFRREEQTYLENILNRILDANPSIDRKDIQILIRKNATANAVSMGQGTIFVHVGLLRLLESESELAFVISHELAHYVLDHTNKRIAIVAQKLNDRNFMRNYKAAAREQYMAHSKTMAFFMETVFDLSRHSRENEFEADSLGLEYMLSAGYDGKGAISLLGILDQSDKPKYEPASFDLRKVFDHEDYPFKETWTQTSTLLSEAMDADETPYWAMDSLKSHPDCPDRIGRILPRANDEGKNGAMFIQPQSSFEELVTVSDYESIRSYFDYHNLSRTLYETLIMAKTHPQDPWLIMMMGRTMLDLHDASKAHQFSRVVERPTKNQSPSYRSLIRFLNKLRLKDYPSLGFYYMQQHWAQVSQYPELVFLQAELAMEAELDEALSFLKDYYRDNFPDGMELNQIQHLGQK